MEQPRYFTARRCESSRKNQLDFTKHISSMYMLKRQFFLFLFTPGLLEDITSVVVGVVLLFVVTVVVVAVVVVVVVVVVASMKMAYFYERIQHNVTFEHKVHLRSRTSLLKHHMSCLHVFVPHLSTQCSQMFNIYLS